jgi:glycosyltransferase involved in cell wall biosynthesis
MARPLLICSKSIHVRSGAGQMIVSQARYFRSQGEAVTVCCQKLGRGSPAALTGIPCQSMSKPVRLLLRSRMRDRLYLHRISRLQRSNGGLIVDHGQSIENADISYVHNFLAPQYASRIPGYLADRRFPWPTENSRSILVANSLMVQRALLEQLKLPEERVLLEYPGYDAGRFSPNVRYERRAESRRQLRIDNEAPVVGLVTSGNFEKRGLHRFLDCVSELRRRHSGLRALVIGAGQWPRALSSHHLYRSGQVLYRPSSFVPEHFFAALDLFLFPARYEEFGIVVLEAMAMGIPVVTSTAVGASELLVAASDRLVIEAGDDEVSSYCRRATDVLGLSDADNKALGAALQRVAQNHTHAAHNGRIHKCISRL